MTISAQLKDLAVSIRKGAKLRPQCTKRFFANNASCVLGAAYEGKTRSSIIGIRDLRRTFPILENRNFRHPILQTRTELCIILMSLNDYYHYTREQIADWLESLAENPSVHKS